MNDDELPLTPGSDDDAALPVTDRPSEHPPPPPPTSEAPPPPVPNADFAASSAMVHDILSAESDARDPGGSPSPAPPVTDDEGKGEAGTPRPEGAMAPDFFTGARPKQKRNWLELMSTGPKKVSWLWRSRK